MHRASECWKLISMNSCMTRLSMLNVSSNPNASHQTFGTAARLDIYLWFNGFKQSPVCDHTATCTDCIHVCSSGFREGRGSHPSFTPSLGHDAPQHQSANCNASQFGSVCAHRSTLYSIPSTSPVTGATLSYNFLP